MSSKITVSYGENSSYDILIQKGILSSVGEVVRPLTKAKRVAIVTDSNVAPLYLKKVIDSFKSADFTVCSFAFTAGEPSKNLETVNKILECFAINQLTRSDLAVALGGGVVGDLTGFASAIYLRGIDFVQIPTSLLAQVDSSVGGKTGCDLPFGKNLCGAFHNPIAVFVDSETLNTLPKNRLADGFAEAIKAGAIRIPELFKLFEDGIEEKIEQIILKSVQMKATIVENDFTEKGERTLLNFGHTLGHAIEKYENFCGLSHGEAVAVGMAIITKASEKAGLTKIGTYQKLVNCLEKYSLPTNTNIPLEKLCEIAINDKKSSGNSIKLVLISEIGKSFVKQIPWDGLYKFLSEGEL